MLPLEGLGWRPADLPAPHCSLLVMLFTLDSQFDNVENLRTGVLDFRPRHIPKKSLVVGVLCAVLFIL